jgi:molybdate transport system ATP-binding protein
MPEQLISLEDITLQIGGKNFFQHTSWEIQKHENWAIIGSTGSGKSLLAKAIAKRCSITHGQIQYFLEAEDPGKSRPYPYPDEVLVFSSEEHRNFMKPYAAYHQARWQSFEGEDVPTVREILLPDWANEKPGGPNEADSEALVSLRRRLEEIAGSLKIEQLLDRKILHLSHGESRKALVARLLLRSPSLLILDDPYTGLDRQSRAALAETIHTIIASGTQQILYIGTRFEDIPSGIDKFLIVKNHAIDFQGGREEALHRLKKTAPQALLPAETAPLPPQQAFQEALDSYTRSIEALVDWGREPVVRMENVRIRYGSVHVLKGIDWTVLAGERWALLGPNGAGKTTLLSLILADNPQAYANDIFLFGKKRGSGESIWEIKNLIGWVSPELHIHSPRSASCEDIVCSGFFDSVGLYQQPSHVQKMVAGRWMAAFGLAGMERELYSSLSSGQQRLVLLARALVKNPPLLVLDEPCQGLDEPNRDTFLRLLNQLCYMAPVTMIFVSHYQDEIPEAVTHRMVLDAGLVEG